MSRTIVAALTAAALAALSATAAASVTPSISSAAQNGFSYTGQRLTIYGSFVKPATCLPAPAGLLYPMVDCYTVEVVCNGTMFPAHITAITRPGSGPHRIDVEFPQRPSGTAPGTGSRCGVEVIVRDASAPGASASGEFYLGFLSSPPIEIHSTVDLGASGGLHRYRLNGYFPVGGNFDVAVGCDGQSKAAAVTAAVLDQLEIQFAQSTSASKSCTFVVKRPVDQAMTPVWSQRVDGPRAALPSWLGAYHWGGFEPDWANRDDSPRLAVRRMGEAGLRGPIRFSLSPQQRITTINAPAANSARYDWYDDYGQGYATDPACTGQGLWSLPFEPYLPYAVCSQRLQRAFDELPVSSTVILTTMDSTSAGPFGFDSYYVNLFWATLNPQYLVDVEEEYYRLAKALYLTQAGSAKTFVISNWEADNMIFCGAAYGSISAYLATGTMPCTDYDTRREALKLWFDARQAGLARAAADFPGAGVTIVDAIEIASYRMVHGSGLWHSSGAAGADALHGLVPRVQPAYVLYSSWETTGAGRVDQDVREISEYLAVHSPGSTLVLGEFGRSGQAGPLALDTWILREQVRAAQRAAVLGPLPGRAWLRFVIVWQAFRTVNEEQQLFSSEGAETAAFRAVLDAAPPPSPLPPASNGSILAVREVSPDRQAVFCENLPSIRGGTTKRYFELYGSFPTGTYTVQTQCASASTIPGGWSAGTIITPMSSLQITMWITEPSGHPELWCLFRTLKNGQAGPTFGPVRSYANGPCNGISLPP